MKKVTGKMALGLAFVFLLSTVLTGSIGGAAAKVITLKIHHHVPPTSNEGRAYADWAKRIEAKTKGRVKFIVFPGSSLGEAKNAVDMAKNGIADISFGFYGFFPNQFPMTEVMTLPETGIKTATQANLVVWDLYAKTDYLKNEWKDVKVLGFFCHGPGIIGTKDKRIDSTADLNGLKLRGVAGPPSDILKKFGAVPMNVPINEVYTSLEKNILNGYAFEWVGFSAWKLKEQTKYILDANLYVGPWFCIMNQKKWDSLPKDIQAAFNEENGEALALANGKVWDNAKASCIKEAKSAGVTVIPLSDALAAEWTAAGKQIAAEWIKKNTEKGYKAQEVYDKFLELVKKYDGR